jgi:hypothetical protein
MSKMIKYVVRDLITHSINAINDQIKNWHVSFENKIDDSIYINLIDSTPFIAAFESILKRAAMDTPSNGVIRIGAKWSSNIYPEKKGKPIEMVIRYGSKDKIQWTSDESPESIKEAFESATGRLMKLGVDVWEREQSDDRPTFHFIMSTGEE